MLFRSRRQSSSGAIRWASGGGGRCKRSSSGALRWSSGERLLGLEESGNSKCLLFGILHSHLEPSHLPKVLGCGSLGLVMVKKFEASDNLVLLHEGNVRGSLVSE